jgi:formin 2
MDAAMSIASLRIPASEVVEALTTLDDISLNAEQATKLSLIIPNEEQMKLLEENRTVAEELSKEEQYLLEILRVPGIKAHLQCMEIKFNFSERFLVLN